MRLTPKFFRAALWELFGGGEWHLTSVEPRVERGTRLEFTGRDTIKSHMAGNLAKWLKYVLFATLAIYVADWAALAIRMAHNGGLGKVTVSQYLATPLKGHKEEYDYLGSVDQPCVRSIFPHDSNQPCWWLERHKEQWQ